MSRGMTGNQEADTYKQLAWLIETSNEWLKKQIKIFELANIKPIQILNMDVSEEEVDNDYASGSERSSIGENSLDSEVSEEHDDMFDDMFDDAFDDMFDDAFDNLIAEGISSCSELSTSDKQLFTRRTDYKTTVFNTMKVLNNLTGVSMGSALYIASMAHLQADVIYREAFLAFPDPEDKICYLEYKTGKKRDE